MSPLTLVAAAAIAALAAASATAGAPPLYLDADAPVETRVANLVARMTLEEKVAQLLEPFPGELNSTALLDVYGATGIGAVYATGLNDGLLAADWYEAIFAFQSQLVARSRLGVPATIVSETLHSSGGSTHDNGTAFPGPILLGSSWNTTLVEAVGTVIALEARAGGVIRGNAPVLQVVTDPRFGRFEEAFGEDPYLVSRMGLAMLLGQQGPNAGGPSAYLNDTQHVSCEAKHAVAYAQSGHDFYRADISERTLCDVYMRPWRAAIGEGGLRGLMVAHQETNGLPMHGNGEVLTGLLRGPAFGGERLFMASDAGNVFNMLAYGLTTDENETAVYALTAGLDQELKALAFPSLVSSVRSGLLNESFVDAAATRVLREKVALRLLDGPEWWAPNGSLAEALKALPEHRALARLAAAEGIVLLQNQAAAASPNGAGTPILPLAAALGSASLARVAVVGPNAGCAAQPPAAFIAVANAYRGGYSAQAAHVVTVLEALTEVPGLEVTFSQGAEQLSYNESGIAAAVAAARAAQLVVAVVGDTGNGGGTCGEGVDADTLDLPGSQLALLAALVANASATPLIVVLVHGRPATFGAGPFAATGPNNALLASLPAVFAAFRPGEEGGRAIRDVISGAVNPSGRLTSSWLRNAGAVRSVAGPYLQQRGAPDQHFVTEPQTPLWPFGFGLSYSVVNISAAAISPPLPPDAPLAANASFRIAGLLNVSSGPAGQFVVQVYYSQDAPTKYVRYSSQLVAFAKVAHGAAPALVPFSVAVRVADLEAWDPETQDFVVYSGNYTFVVAGDSAQAQAKGAPFALHAAVRAFDWRRPRFPGAP